MYKMFTTRCQGIVKTKSRADCSDNPVNMSIIGLMVAHCFQRWPALNEHCFRVSVSRALGRMRRGVTSSALGVV